MDNELFIGWPAMEWPGAATEFSPETVLEGSGLALLVQQDQPAYEDDVFGVPSCCFDQM